MDGVHDLGGREGFGPITVTTDEPAFHEDWEGRVYGMVQSVGPEAGSIDWFRNLVELMPPAAYLNEPYFQKWHFVHLVEMIQGGMVSRDEVLTGKTARPAPPAEAMDVDRVLARIHTKERSFACPVAEPPAFAAGQAVRTQRQMPASHTRLPLYARDRVGEVIAHHGAHVLPDDSARGIERGEHLYTVRFDATELWGAAADPRDDVTIDLWESYLSAA